LLFCLASFKIALVKLNKMLIESWWRDRPDETAATIRAYVKTVPIPAGLILQDGRVVTTSLWEFFLSYSTFRVFE